MINFSQWNATLTAQNGRRRNGLGEINQVVVEGRMPPGQYLILHPNAALNQAEAQQLAQGLQKSLGVVPNLVSGK